MPGQCTTATSWRFRRRKGSRWRCSASCWCRSWRVASVVRRRDFRASEIGLPDSYLWIALLTFNVGVELGQRLVVAAAYPVYRAFAGGPKFAVARAPALYAIGGVAAYWSIGRIVSILA